MSETAEQKTMNFGDKQMYNVVIVYLDPLRNFINLITYILQHILNVLFHAAFRNYYPIVLL